MEKPHIWISDLTHTAQGISANTFPLGASYVYSYSKQKMGKDFNFKLFKFPDNLADALKVCSPKMLCFSSYSWNFELSYKFASLSKKRDPNLVVVFGGPNFPTDEVEKFEFLQKRPSIDFFVELEGELGLVDIVQKLTKYNFKVDSLKSYSEKILNTTYIFEDHLISGSIKRIKDINVIPSPYLTGSLDEFFKFPLIPMIETTRGCPFSCSFCADGLESKNKVHRYDSQRTKDELEYIAKRVQGVDDLVVTDLNFGMYKQDLATANEIASIQKVYNFPQIIGASSGKNKPKRIIEVARIVKGWSPGASIQSSDYEVLKSIKRENLSTEAYSELITYINSFEGEKSESEIILGLPSDTKEKHFESLRFGMDNNVTTLRMFQAIMLVGTEMASKQYRKSYGIKTKFRSMPGTIGYYKIFDEQQSVGEIEEIIVGNNTFKESDYLECRVMNLLIATFYNNSMFGEVFEMLKAIKFSCFDCFFYMKNHPEIYSERIKKIIKRFEKETLEVFDSWQEAHDSISDPTLIKQYIDGDMGTNELLLSRALLFNEFEDVSDLMFDSVKSSLEEKNQLTQECRNYLFELKSFLTMLKKDPLIKIKTVKSALFKYDFEEIRKSNYHIDPNSLPVLDSPLNFDFFHDESQQKHISNQIELYSHHSISLGKLLQNSNLNLIFRRFKKSKRQM
tara:strand:- start:488 stop:2524 length:2037 start_codon:yes stop_codon:yes gene_type:complete